MQTKELAGKKILVFGGLGFIGRNLTAMLLDAGVKVKVTTREIAGKNLKIAEKIKNLEIVECNTLDGRVVESVIDKDIDIIFNLAGHSGAKVSLEDPYMDLQVNVYGILNILEAARKKSRAAVIFSGSRLEYGIPKNTPVDESHPISPNTIHGVNKFAAGQYCLIYQNFYDLKTVVFRASNPYGPHVPNPRPSYNIINFFIDQAIQGNTIKIFGDGKQKRDYFYVGDFCEAMISAALTPKSYGEIFNIGYGKGIRLIDAANEIVKVVGKGKVKKVPWPKDYLKVETGDYVSNVSKIKKKLGWTPKTSLIEGIEKTVNIIESKKGTLGLLLQI